MLRKFHVIRYIWVCFFPYDLRFIGSLAIFTFFLSFKHNNHQLPTIDSAILPTAYCGSQSKNPPHIRQKRRELGRVNFRKDFWDYFQRQGKNIGQQRASQPLFEKSDRKDRLFKFKIQENIGIFCQNVGSLQQKKNNKITIFSDKEL